MTFIMLSRTLKAPVGANSTLKLGFRAVQPMRTYTTVQANVARQMPEVSRTRPTKQNHGERATFTIRDGPIFTGESFGARSNISGEAVFTTSLVGYPESLSE
jgi:Carbamoyl-phosphate synthase small chain, CPSase domain